MPAVQSTYSTQSAARDGMLADMQEGYNAFSRTVETAAGLAFGKPVQRGAADGGCKAIGDGSATTFLGVSLRTQSRDANNGDIFAQREDARIADKGVIWVTVGANVAAGDPVYYTTAGVWTNASSGNVLVANAVWDSTAASGARAKLRLK